MRHLIVVAGHAVPFRFDRLDSDEGWYLKPFQKGEGRFYTAHAEAGVRLASEDPGSLLIFSGGQTDGDAGPRSEGQGYWLIAEYREWFGDRSVRERAQTEEFSRDSLENVLFSLCRFREVTGFYPERLTCVGWQFKEKRFDLHRAAVRFPRERYRYVGVNDPEDLATAEGHEEVRRQVFERDPYGAGPEPASKREARNPFRRYHGYRGSCPEAAALLDHRGPELFAGPLPWA
ncbi:MAG TPA: hypothetical protein DEH78_11545 [Solibacterales bacterium]|nr:hypothetical protein [Bryobacterales bacterium]